MTGMQNFLKDTLTLVKVSNGPMVWAIPFFIFMAAASAFSGLLMLTACMKRYDATYSAASFVGSFVISASIMSAAHYRTFQSLGNIWSYILYPVGLLVLMVGVYVLVRERQEVIDDEIDDEDEIIVAMRKNSEDSQVRLKEHFLHLSSDCQQLPLRRWSRNTNRYHSCTPRSKTTERSTKVERYELIKLLSNQ